MASEPMSALVAEQRALQPKAAQGGHASQIVGQQVLIGLQLHDAGRAEDEVIAGEENAALAVEQATVLGRVTRRFDHFQMPTGAVEGCPVVDGMDGGRFLEERIALAQQEGNEFVELLIARGAGAGDGKELLDGGRVEGPARTAVHALRALVQDVGHVARVVIVEMGEEHLGVFPGATRCPSQVVEEVHATQVVVAGVYQKPSVVGVAHGVKIDAIAEMEAFQGKGRMVEPGQLLDGLDQRRGRHLGITHGHLMDGAEPIDIGARFPRVGLVEPGDETAGCVHGILGLR